MNHPPYHLRLNKAVDRNLLIEVLSKLSNNYTLSNYTYYGLCGPFLEDCRLINTFYPNIKMVSIEQNEETYKRQKFHKFTKRLELHHASLNDFITTYSCTGREIFWLDYTDLKIERFLEFNKLLDRGCNGTIIKLTLRANREQGVESFKEIFQSLLPSAVSDQYIKKSLPELIQKMIRKSVEGILPASNGIVFQPISSTYYSDGTDMLNVTGIICELGNVDMVKGLFATWKFANTEWEAPHKIKLPVLSIKERLHLEHLLPDENNTERNLATKLGYMIGESEAENSEMMRQYADFYKYYPYFTKVAI
ncbi:MAG TPA: hypothetical protein PKH33_10225 [bacterium]|nr:hypothetical protein [bacterium]